MHDRPRFRPFVLLALALSAAPATAQLSVVNMKDGKKVEGFLLTQDDKVVRVETIDGKTMSFDKTKVDSVEETKRWGDPEIDAEFEKLDASDAAALATLAETAYAKKSKVWNRLAQAVLKLDKDNETANKLLGREKVGDTWYADKKKADEARKKLKEEEMKAKGFVSVGNGDKKGWIKKELRSAYDKNNKDFVLDDDGLYRPAAEVMAERGMEFDAAAKKWIPRATAEDKADCAKFKADFEVDCWGMTSKHFRVFSTEHKIEKVAEFAALCEKNHKWFLERHGLAPETELFPEGARGQLWFVKDKRLFDKVVTKWGPERFGMSADWIAYITRPGTGGGTHSGRGLYGVVSVDQLDETGVKASAVHNSSHMLIDYFTQIPTGTPPWLVEAWSHYAEKNFLNIGAQTCVTKATYAAGGGVSDKKFSTKDSETECKRMIKAGEGDPYVSISRKDLNALNGDDLAKGFTLVDWLMKKKRTEFTTFLTSIKEGNDEKTMQGDALKKAFGWSWDDLEKNWQEWGLKNF